MHNLVTMLTNVTIIKEISPKFKHFVYNSIPSYYSIKRTFTKIRRTF